MSGIFQAFQTQPNILIGCGNADSDWLFAWGFDDRRRHAKPEEIEPLPAAKAAA